MQSPTPTHLKDLNSPFLMKLPGSSVFPTGHAVAHSFVEQVEHRDESLTFSLNNPR